MLTCFGFLDVDFLSTEKTNVYGFNNCLIAVEQLLQVPLLYVRIYYSIAVEQLVLLRLKQLKQVPLLYVRIHFSIAAEQLVVLHSMQVLVLLFDYHCSASIYTCYEHVGQSPPDINENK